MIGWFLVLSQPPTSKSEPCVAVCIHNMHAMNYLYEKVRNNVLGIYL